MRQMVGSTDEFLTKLPHLIATLGANHIWIIFLIPDRELRLKKRLVVSV